jgi:protein subunit release factor B
MADLFATDRETLEKEAQVSFFRAGGPGGQHRNVTESGVRLFHPPSGITVSATERRSQAQNREAAFERLATLLRARNRRQKTRVATQPPRAAEERRLEEKRERGEAKRRRRTPETDESAGG